MPLWRLLFIGYFEGLSSERGIAWRVADSLSLRAFLDLDVTEAPPNHSTLSRTRRLIDRSERRVDSTGAHQEGRRRGSAKGPVQMSGVRKTGVSAGGREPAVQPLGGKSPLFRLTSTSPGATALERPRPRSPQTPAGRTPGRSAASTPGSTAGGSRMRPSPPSSPNFTTRAGRRRAPRRRWPGSAGPGAPLGDALQLRAGERSPGDAEAGLLPAGEPGVAAAPREGREAARRPGPPPGGGNPRRLPRGRRRGARTGGRRCFQSVDRVGERLTGRALTRRVVLVMIKRPSGGGGAPAVDLLPHVPGDGDHGVSVERGNPRARPADRPTRVAQDNQALRPDDRHGDHRRDRTHRDLNSCCRKAMR